MEDNNAGNLNTEHDDTHTVEYWKQRALHMEKLLEASLQREQVLVENLAELSQNSNIDDNFLHSILQNAPVVIGHQDKDLRYRYIYNHFPSLQDEDIIGKTDLEVFKGGGIKECQEFKKKVLEHGLPVKREITYETELFGTKTFLMYLEPVFSNAGEKTGINYMGMDITDEVKKREKMVKLREEIAVQKARESELHKHV
ncbi:histidine kinase 5-like protein [Tanacetum coccineum]